MAYGTPNKWLLFLPLFTCICFPVTFFISYGWAVVTKHVNSTDDFPYISETGTKPPESCVFGQLLNIAAVSVGLTIYIRYRQTDIVLSQYKSSPHPYRTNFAALIIGWLASFGVSMVGNFQMDNILIMHFIGAGLAFVLGTVYAWMQVYLSFTMLGTGSTKLMCWIRLVVSIITTIFLVGTVLGAQFYGVTNNSSFRLLSTCSEWIMAFGLAIVFATFTSELKNTKIEKPRVFVMSTFNES